MVTIVDLSPSSCKSSHLPVLFAAYSASLSVTGKATFSTHVCSSRNAKHHRYHRRRRLRRRRRRRHHHHHHHHHHRCHHNHRNH